MITYFIDHLVFLVLIILEKTPLLCVSCHVSNNDVANATVVHFGGPSQHGRGGRQLFNVIFVDS